MSIEVRWEGMNEFRKALKDLPEELHSEASDIVMAHANEAAILARDAYPVRTTGLNPSLLRKTRWFPPGSLKSRVRAPRNESKVLLAKFRVRSDAPHAHLFEYGTKERRNKSGANRGAMPEAPENQAFVGYATRVRRRMVVALIALVRRAGFEVLETAA